MEIMPGPVLVGLGLCALNSADHCIAAASAHMGGSPITPGFPGIHVKPLFPSRRTMVPCASVSTMRAAFKMSAGPADNARAILACAVSPELVAELCSAV